jgi:hypothetical protein
VIGRPAWAVRKQKKDAASVPFFGLLATWALKYGVIAL